MSKRTALALAMLAGSALPALAFDCRAASTATEKAICATPAALDADAAMSKAWDALRARLPASDKAALLGSQRQWLTQRDATCSDSQGAAMGACLAREINLRRSFLEGRPVAGPGLAAQLTPSVRVQAPARNRADIAIETLRFASPSSAGERLFNAEVDRQIKDAPLGPQTDMGDSKWSFQLTMSLPWAAPDLVSAHVEASSYQGGAHPNSWTDNININLATGRLWTFADAVEPRNAQAIFDLCAGQVKAVKEERQNGDRLDDDEMKELRKNIAETTRELKTWSFGGAGVVVTYDPYAVGAYAEGAFSCALPYALLRPLIRSGFPLPRSGL